MRNLYLLIGALVILLPGVAQAVTCTSNTDFIWDNIDTETGWTCAGSGSAGDDFVIASGHVVTVNAGNIAVTTGTIVVQSGGILRVEAGNELQFGASLKVEVGGWLDAQGAIVDECRISSAVSWSTAGSAVANVDCTRNATANATDWIVFGDDDPEGVEETLNRREVQVGPGPPIGGAYRPSYNKWAWYDITAENLGAEGTTADVSYNMIAMPANTVANVPDFTGTPYAGTRGVPTRSAITASDLETETPDWLGLTSSVQIDQTNGVSDSITAITIANPAVVTTGTHPFVTGDTVYITGIVDNGPNGDLETALNSKIFHITVVDADTFQLDNTSTSGLTNTWASAGTVVLTVAATDADLGSMYLAYNELLGATANDPSYCSGMHAKILHVDNVGGTDDDGAGENLEANDILYVAGDISRCTNGTAFITPGARRGDPVYIVRPALLSGDNDADGVGEGYIWIDGGKITAEWTSFADLGFITNTDPAINVTRHANILFTEGGADGSSTDPTGYIVNSQIIFPVTNTTDTGVIEIASLDDSFDMRLVADGPLDGSGLTFDRIHIHDGQNNGTNAGTHGFFVDGAKNLTVTRLRIERMSDDGLGATVASGTNTNTPNSMTFRHIIVTEQLASTANSQQGFEIGENNTLTADGSLNAIVNAGALTVSDVYAGGTRKHAFVVRGLSSDIDRVVSGGILGTEASIDYPFDVALGTAGANGGGTISVTLATDYPTQVNDSIIGVFSGTTDGGSEFSLGGSANNSIVVGAAQLAAGVDQDILGINAANESILDVGQGDTNGIMSSGTTAPGAAGFLNFTDTVFRAVGGDRLLRDYAAVLLTMRRTITIGGAGVSDGEFATFDTQGGSVDLDGHISTWTTPGNVSPLLQNNGTITNNVCYMSSGEVRSVVFAEGGGLSATTLLVSDIEPKASTGSASLRGLTYNPRIPLGGHPCNDARPRYLGLRNFGVTHALLGDFVIEQNQRWSSSNLIGVVRGGSIQSGKSF